MRALGLGKVSRNKQRRATTSDDTITADRDGPNRRHSHQEAPKLSQNEPLKHEEEGRGNQLQNHKRPCQRARQERREGVISIATKLIAQQQLLSQGRQLPQLLYVETNRRPFHDRKP
jgi:hypothetical protein